MGEGTGVSKQARQELIEALRQRYGVGTKGEKTRILDEFVAVSGCHRKHAIRLLNTEEEISRGSRSGGRRIYDEAVREVLIIAWEAADRICGKRLKAVLPSLIGAMERHGHLQLDSEVRERALSASAASIDRLLAPVRGQAGRRRRRRRAKKVSKQVAVRTFSDWQAPVPGYLEIDMVAHCGGVLTGSFIHSLVVTDVCSGWTEAVPTAPSSTNRYWRTVGISGSILRARGRTGRTIRLGLSKRMALSCAGLWDTSAMLEALRDRRLRTCTVGSVCM